MRNEFEHRIAVEWHKTLERTLELAGQSQGKGVLVFDLDSTSPATMCHADPLSHRDIFLFWTRGIDSSPSRTNSRTFTIVSWQYDATGQGASREIHLFYDDMIVQRP
jgi:hypothetical protein